MNTRSFEDFSKLQNKYGGKYVASQSGAVICADRDFSRLAKKLLKKRVNLSNILFEFIPREDVVYVHCRSL